MGKGPDFIYKSHFQVRVPARDIADRKVCARYVYMGTYLLKIVPVRISRHIVIWGI